MVNPGKRRADSDLNNTDPSSLKKGKFIDGYISQISNRYDALTEGPFMVLIFDSREDHSLGNVHPMVIGKRFRLNKIEAINIDKFSEDRISVLFNSAVEANEFVENTIKKLDPLWLAYIPSSSIQFTGIVRDVPEELDKVEILEGITDERIKEQIVDIIRIKRRNLDIPNVDVNNPDGNLVDTNSIKIIFNKELPNYLYINCCYRKIYKFIPQVKRCFNCQKYGHTSFKCKANYCCVVCGKTHVKDIDCKNVEKCVNCEGAHRASDKNCPCFIFYKEVNKVKTLSNLKYNEALDIVKTRYINKYNSNRNKDKDNSSCENIIRALNLDISLLNSRINESVKDIPLCNSTFNVDEIVAIQELNQVVIEEAAKNLGVNYLNEYAQKVVFFLENELGNENEVLKKFLDKDSNHFDCVEGSNRDTEVGEKSDKSMGD